MEVQHLRDLLNNLHEPAASKELSSIAENFLASNEWKLLEAVCVHLIAQNLRAANGGLEGYGRVQGIHAVMDFFLWLKLVKSVKPETEPETSQPTKKPTSGGYGVI